MQSCRFAYFNTHSLVDIVVAILVLKGAGATTTATATRTAKEHFSRASRFFVHSLLSFYDYSVNAYFHVLSRTGTQDKTTTVFFFPWTLIQSFRIQLQKNLQKFDELNEME